MGAGWRELRGSLGKLGASRVSFAGSLPDAEMIAAVLADQRIVLEAVVHPFLYGQQLDAPDATIVSEQRKLAALIRLVASLSGRSIFLSTGGRGRLTWEQAAATFGAAVAPCVELADSAGIALMVENTPHLYADVNIVHSLRDAITLAELAGIGICLDVFSCWMEAGLAEAIERAMPRCHLIQVKDYVYGDRALPGSAVPGDGIIPLFSMLEMTLAAGYGGVFDLEMSGPRIDAEGHLPAARRGTEHLTKLLVELGA